MAEELLLLNHWHGRIVRHCLLVRFLHRRSFVGYLTQNFEIVDVERWRKSTEDPCLLIKRIGKGVRRAHRDCDKIPYFAIHIFGVFETSGMEANGAIRDQEAFIMHFVPMRKWTRCSRGDDKFDSTEAVVYGP